MTALSAPVTVLHGVGPKLKERFAVLGIETLHDLLWYFPRIHKDRSQIINIVDIPLDRPVTARGIVKKITSRHAWHKRHMAIVEAVVNDETGSLRVVWFNQSYLAETLHKGDVILLTGIVKITKYGRAMQSPEYEKVWHGKETTHAGRIVPEYPLTTGVTQKQMRYCVTQALKHCLPVTDWIPNSILKQANVAAISTALQQVHFPDTMEQFERAQERFAFDELLLIQIASRLLQQENDQLSAPSLGAHERVRQFILQLPFTLTNAQQQVLAEILRDIQRTAPMNRLLVGDVGSGKTVVAAAAMVAAVASGYQAALMAPTELLAAQHAQTLQPLLTALGITVELRTSSTVQRMRIASPTVSLTTSSITHQEISQTTSHHSTAPHALLAPDVIIGTHALIQEGVMFHKLGLAIIDEQHRFGVAQRKALRKHSGLQFQMPHLLSMSATPIPRTLALTLYGDLALSVIDELPIGRQKIKTYLVPTEKRDGSYQFIRKHIQQGEQCFVICPLIEPSDVLGVRSVTAEYERLSKEVFSDLRVGMLHGKMKPREKQCIMSTMHDGKIDVLVATSVVEVGVDIPNATIMMIEGAERFGLAQLHQFRGRVGRSHLQSYCLLFTDDVSTMNAKRLKAMTTSSNGFKLAELDLKLRGSGEFYGTAQTGLSSAALLAYQFPALVERARHAANTIITTNMQSHYKALHNHVDAFLQRLHFE